VTRIKISFFHQRIFFITYLSLYVSFMLLYTRDRRIQLCRTQFTQTPVAVNSTIGVDSVNKYEEKKVLEQLSMLLRIFMIIFTPEDTDQLCR